MFSRFSVQKAATSIKPAAAVEPFFKRFSLLKKVKPAKASRCLFSTAAENVAPKPSRLPLIERLKTPLYIGRVYGWSDGRLFPYYLGAVVAVASPVTYFLSKSSNDNRAEKQSIKNICAKSPQKQLEGLKTLNAVPLTVNDLFILRGYVQDIIDNIFRCENDSIRKESIVLLKSLVSGDHQYLADFRNEVRKIGGIPLLMKLIEWETNISIRKEGFEVLLACIEPEDSKFEFTENRGVEVLKKIVSKSNDPFTIQSCLVIFEKLSSDKLIKAQILKGMDKDFLFSTLKDNPNWKSWSGQVSSLNKLIFE